ncbi:MAG TPA: copper amine oxidase N-terminal domain-containing protein [Candidatus Bathyarchaeia archaeon]|nr:copper amine oxidase N-terminal domain-containing protein [Candidatus Bathyarchaeia archaeon]
MEKSKKLLPVVLAVTALAATPFANAPKAYAIDDLEIEADDYDTDVDTKYTVSFTLEEDLDEDDEITIEFDSEFDLSDIDQDNDVSVEIDGNDETDIDVGDDTITITVSDDYSDGDEVEIIIDNVRNPEEDDEYDISVETDNESSKTETIEIGDGADNDNDDDDDDGDFEVDLTDDEEDKKSGYDLGSIDIGDDDLALEEGDEVIVTFPDEDMLPDEDDYEEGDITINGEDVEEDGIEIDGNEITLTIPDGLDDEEELEIEFDEDFGIRNPMAADDYTITVEYDDEEYESEEFEIVDEDGNSTSNSGSDSDFAVTLSDANAGSRSSYTFEADFGSKYKLEPGKDVIVTFPTSEMLPPSIDKGSVFVNGKESKSVYISGNKVYVTAPDSVSKSGKVKVSFGYYSWITNPKTAGSYDISMSVSGKTITSKKFSITGTPIVTQPPVVTPPIVPVTPAVTANNSLAVVTKTKAGLNQVTGFNIQVKQVGEQLVAGKDYLQVTLPVGFKVPTAIPITNASVNGVYPSKVVVSGQNILIYPKQNIAQNAPATIIITEAAKITNPAVKNVYSVSVATSAHKGPLFSRLVGIGGAVVPAVTPAPTPTVTFPVNAARIKVGVANFTLRGNTYPLKAAPFLANGTTTAVPAQFFKEALAMSTIWNNNTVSIVSGTTAMRFTVGSNIARVGTQSVVMPAAVTLQNGMPMIPLKFVADQLGYKVLWDAKTSSVGVFK